MRATPSRRVAWLYLRGHRSRLLRSLDHLEATATLRSPFCNQISLKSKLFAHLLANVHFFLYLCSDYDPIECKY